MNTEKDTIVRFYSAFAKRDWQEMVRCYAAEATFTDPVFRGLQGREIEQMWRALTERAKDFSLEFRDVEATGGRGRAHWEARYIFSATGNPVHNVIDAEFTFRDGLIATHVDSFSLYRWARQALGAKGVLLGWAPPVQAAIRRQARKGIGLGPERSA